MVAILVIFTFVILVVVDIYVVKYKRKRKTELGISEISPLTATARVFTKKSILAPEGYYFYKGHTWARVFEGGLLKIGIDDFVKKALGKIVIEKVAPENRFVKQGDIIIEGKFDSKKVTFRSPVFGIVRSANNDIIGKSITDPYGKDWGLVVAPINMEDNLNTLKKDFAAIDWMKDEFKRLKDFLSENAFRAQPVGVTMYDGGNVIEGAIANIDEEGMKQFEEEFLSY
jgi:glycine cleavage system H lipoate-binding protein